MGNMIDISGKKYGLLTVIRISGKQTTGYKLYIWECVCECGNIINVPKHYLTSGDTKSCGCLALKVRREMHITHGGTKHRLYSVWKGMIQRCYDKYCNAYKNYGGRGIKVCVRWRNSFGNFLLDMGDSYVEGLTLERVDNNGNYIKSNTKWIPFKDQAKNRRTAVIIEYNGKKQSVTEFSKELGLNAKLLFQRLKKGWSVEDAIFVANTKESIFQIKNKPIKIYGKSNSKDG